MIAPARFAYVQARVQARYAELPAEDDWQRLAGARTLGAFLEEAREGALRGWVKGFSALSDAHDLDRGLRALWLEGVEDLVPWLPRTWRPAFDWLRWLPLLPLLAHAARRQSLPTWVARDSQLHPLLGPDGVLSPPALISAGGEALLVPPDDLGGAWLGEWRRRWPASDRCVLVNLERLVALIQRHAGAFVQGGAEAAWPLRRELRERMRLDFHRLPLQPTAILAFLALVALDLERLRAALMQRALFGTQEAV